MHSLASEDVHANVAAAPAVTDAGLADKLTVGTGGGSGAGRIVCSGTSLKFWLPPVLALSWATNTPLGNAAPNGDAVTSMPSVPVTPSMLPAVTTLNDLM